MNLKSVLTEDSISLNLKGTNKDEIITEMLDILVRAGKISDREGTLKAVLAREAKMSTGMKHGIAIPHGKSECVDELVVAIGVSENEVDFDSLDYEPCRIFILTVSPLGRTGPHLQFLAEISQLFKSAEKRREIINAKSAQTVIQVLVE